MLCSTCNTINNSPIVIRPYNIDDVGSKQATDKAHNVIHTLDKYPIRVMVRVRVRVRVQLTMDQLHELRRIIN